VVKNESLNDQRFCKKKALILKGEISLHLDTLFDHLFSQGQQNQSL
jgi:hypothetical protein